MGNIIDLAVAANTKCKGQAKTNNTEEKLPMRNCGANLRRHHLAQSLASLAALLAVVPTASLAAASPPEGVVVPAAAASNDTPFGSGTLANVGYRNQTVYDKSQFPANAILITELRFRPDSTYGAAFSTTIPDIQVNLSTTTAAPDALSELFAANVGRDDTVVLQGPVQLESAFTGPVGEPKDFDIVLKLKRPFLYSPSTGNLLVDIRNYSGSSATFVSGLGDFGDGASRVGGPIEDSTGFADTGADAMRIGYRQTGASPTPNPTPQPGNTVVLPNILANADSVLGSGTLVNPGFRNQQVYDASQLPVQPIKITELRFRPDSVYGQSFNTTIQNIQVNLSTTTRSSDALSTVYSENIGPDDKVVLSGSVHVKSTFSGGTGEAKDFDIILKLAEPFTYNPAFGNLLIDIRNYSGSSSSLLSGSAVSGEGASRLGGNINDPVGFPDTAADAIRIKFTPEN